VVIPYWHFMKTYIFHLQRSISQKDSWSLRLEPMGCPKIPEGIATTHCVIAQKSTGIKATSNWPLEICRQFTCNKKKIFPVVLYGWESKNPVLS
jgi:hypothetical protein